MGMLKVGDKLEVMVDYPNHTTELKTSILTVIKPDGYNTNSPNHFLTNTTFDVMSTWIFDTSCIGKELKLLTINPTLVSTPMQFKVGDTTEWLDGSHWEIINENANDFEIKLIQLGNYHGYLTRKIGDILWYPKANFRTAKLVAPQIHGQNQRITMTFNGINILGEKEMAFEINPNKTNNCCCGAWACKDSGHSTWCDLYKPMWKDG